MKGTSMRGDWWQALFAGCAALAFGTLCHAADSKTPASTTGKYDSQVAAPDKLTTIDGSRSLKVTGGSAAPDRPLDQGKVRLEEPNGSATATFSGRSTGWGCTYSVNGIYEDAAVNDKGKGGQKEEEKWASSFDEANEPRLRLEINDDGPADDVVLMGTNGGKLKIWILDATGTHTVSLAANPADKLSGLPASTSVSAGTTPAEVALNGAKSGQVTITANATVNSQTLGDQISAQVSGFKGKIVPENNFDGRSLQKLGVGETGELRVELDPGTTLADLKPLTWAIDAGSGMTLQNITKNGTAEFTAADTPSDTTLSLTDKNGNKVTMTISTIQPAGAYQVKGPEGKFPGGVCSAYMANYTYLLPKDVSFWKIEVNEGACVARAKDGLKHKDGLPHAAWAPVAVGKGDIGTGCLVKGPNNPGPLGVPGDGGAEVTKHYDFVHSGALDLTVGAGTFYWDIPWQYSVGAVDKKEFTKLLHHISTDGNKTVSVTKGNETTTQTGP